MEEYRVTTYNLWFSTAFSNKGALQKSDPYFNLKIWNKASMFLLRHALTTVRVGSCSNRTTSYDMFPNGDNGKWSEKSDVNGKRKSNIV